jgi:hypothetical protein
MSAIAPTADGGGRAWRRARPAAAAGVAIVLLGLLAAPGVVAQSPAVGLDGAQVIRDALDALAARDSYRCDWREQGGDLAVERRTTGIVVGGDLFRSYRETAVGDEAPRGLSRPRRLVDPRRVGGSASPRMRRAPGFRHSSHARELTALQRESPLSDPDIAMRLEAVPCVDQDARLSVDFGP